MVERQYGYKKTEVDGTELTMKETFEGTDLSSAVRRMAIADDIGKARVEYDGVVTLYVHTDGSWNVSDYAPDGFEVVDALVHEHSGNAHVKIRRE